MCTFLVTLPLEPFVGVYQWSDSSAGLAKIYTLHLTSRVSYPIGWDETPKLTSSQMVMLARAHFGEPGMCV